MSDCPHAWEDDKLGPASLAWVHERGVLYRELVYDRRCKLCGEIDLRASREREKDRKEAARKYSLNETLNIARVKAGYGP